MSETNTTVTTPEETTATEPERTFTQSELDAIVRDRLARERGKYADYEELKEKAGKFDEAEEASKSELQKATEKATALEAQLTALTREKEISELKSKVSAELGVPAGLLTADTEEDLRAQAEAILAFAKPSEYPTVKDGGEVTKTAGLSTKQQFAQWADAAFN